MDIPNNHTFKILEKRKSNLLKKNINNDDSYVNWEIGALDRIMNFTKLVMNNFPNEIIEKLVNEYDLNHKTNDEKPDDEREPFEILYKYEKNITKDFKINISFIKSEDRYILFEPKKYVKNKYKWESRGRMRITAAVLEEALKKAKEIEPAPRPESPPRKRVVVKRAEAGAAP
jgi:hypothetical protein